MISSSLILILTGPFLQKANETVLGLAADPVRRTYWVYTDQSLFEIVVGNEDRDVWKIYLDKGHYEVALRYAKVPNTLVLHHLCLLT